ncbi:MAG TPA: restriction endonuclease subunit R [Cyanobacteria bacterium UBA8553]|nr:restriction endonuclease subunit R [Cyanobacteria bacterium UBA8553]HAJ63840.1 restriction endonuclease subunit R [Cyanobacteria bacterium UBA8543]
MTTLKFRNLSLIDVHRLLGIQPLYDGSFTPLLTVEPITATEQQELDRIQSEFRNYWVEGKVSEGQVRLVAIAPLLRLAGFHEPPIKLNVEEDIARIYIEDEDTYITGRFDIVAVNKEKPTGNSIPLWILIVESKNSEASESTGLPQLLTYAFNTLERQESVWGLATNGLLYQFVYIRRGNPPTYQFMPILSFFERDRSIQLLQVLKAICKL